MEERGGGRGSEEQEEEREDICTLLFTYICLFLEYEVGERGREGGKLRGELWSD